MTKYSTILMFISSAILLILKLTDLKELNTIAILEIAFYIGIITYTTYILYSDFTRSDIVLKQLFGVILRREFIYLILS